MLGVVFASLGRFVYRRGCWWCWPGCWSSGSGSGSAGEVFGRLGTGSGLRDDAESVVVADLLGRVGGGGTGISGLVDGRPVGDPASGRGQPRPSRDLEATPGVERVTSPWAGRPGSVRAGRPGTGGRCWSGSSWRAG